MTNPNKPYANLDEIKITKAAVGEEPALGNVTFKLSAKSNGGIAVLSKTGALIQNGQTDQTREGKFTLIGDEPVALLGTDTGVSPAEYILQGLAGCYVVTLASMAAEKGINLDSIELDLNFDINLNGFLGLDKNVRNGAQGIRVDVKLNSSSATVEELDALVKALPSHSPIHDTLANPVNITTKLV